MITLSSVLKEYNRNEFHHIYPKAFVLSKFENTEYDVNCLANFCMLSRADNKKIDCKAPSIYRANDMPENSEEILKSNLIDEHELINDEFNNFVMHRAKSIFAYLESLI